MVSQLSEWIVTSFQIAQEDAVPVIIVLAGWNTAVS